MHKLKTFFKEQPDLVWEIIRFIIVGVIATLTDYLTYNFFFYLILKEDFKWWIIDAIFISKSAGFIISVIANYLLSIFMVFKNVSNKKISRSALGFIIFILLSLLGFFLNVFLTYLGNLIYPLKDSFWWNSSVFFTATLIVLVYNYLSRKFLLFKSHPTKDDTQSL